MTTTTKSKLRATLFFCPFQITRITYIYAYVDPLSTSFPGDGNQDLPIEQVILTFKCKAFCDRTTQFSIMVSPKTDICGSFDRILSGCMLTLNEIKFIDIKNLWNSQLLIDLAACLQDIPIEIILLLYDYTLC